MKLLVPAFLAISLLTGCAVLGTAPGALVNTPPPSYKGEGEIDRFIVDEMHKRHIAGLAAAVISDGQVRFARGYGFANLEGQVPVRLDSPFLIASITKMITATGIMLLVQDGKVRLDAPIGEYLDQIPNHWRRATVRQLLGHTAGINSYSVHDAPPCGQTTDEKHYTQQDVIGEVACLPLDFEPGTAWSYSDSGYFVLGLLIERMSGLTYEEYLRRNILKPLGMHSTRLIGATVADDGRAVGYFWDGRRLMRATSLSPVVEGPVGGLVSTLADLARFDAALSDDRLLPQTVLRKMWQPLGVGTALYGLGFGVKPINGRPQIGHTGGGPGAATSFARFVNDDLTVIVLTNTAQPPSSIQEIVGGIAERVLQPLP